MLSLDSPKWKEFRTAYGSAERIPALVRAIAEEKEVSYSRDLAEMRRNPSPWEEVYNHLCHQYSICLATYAAFPHLVSIAEQGNLGKQLEALTLSGAICAFGEMGEEDTVTEELLEPFETAMKKMKQMSLDIVRRAVAEKRLENYPLPYLLQSVLAIRFGKHVVVQSLDHLVDKDCELEGECPECGSYMIIEVRDVPATKPVDEKGRPDVKRRIPGVVDQAAHALELEEGQRLIADTSEYSWKADDVVAIGAALALAFDDKSLSTRIFNLHSKITCPACKHQFRITEGILEI